MANMYESTIEESKRIQTPEEILGKGAMQPFVNTNSAIRKIMQSNQLEQAIALINPEPPIVQTGYEIRFGDLSSSIIQTDSNIEIIDKISKFENYPNVQYYLIYRDHTTGEFGVYLRKGYYHSTEAYGYLYNNEVFDSLDVGYEVPKGTILRKSTSFDEYMNRCDGVNLITGYINCNKTMEDGILISETAAKKLASPLIREVEVIVNDNDILLNIFGDRNHFKSFPDIGETITSGILCATRREKTEECLYMQSIEQLSTLLISDTKYTVNGKVIDIDIRCNNPEGLEDRYSNSQIRYYYHDHRRMIREIIESVDRIKKKYGKDAPISYKLKELYHKCKAEEEGKLFIKDKPYTGTKIVFYVLEENKPIKGDKITNRYGGKGVISEVLPDESMPMLDNGQRIEVCFNGSTCVNRLNWGQLAENSVTFIGCRLLEYISETRTSEIKAIELIHQYLSFISEKEASAFLELLYDDGVKPEDRDWYLDKMIEDGYIMVSNSPISESMSLDRLNEMYKAFPFIKPYDAYVTINDSNNQPRWVKANRPIVCGKMYIYRLKQYAEEKFSVTSLSSTNIKNENTRNKANKMYRSLHSNTPIRFGEMETEDFMHMGVEHVISTLMIHSVSPQARRLVESMLTGDPYHVDIVLDENSRNRNVEILNAYLKAIGLRIVFEKRPKKKIQLIKGVELLRPIPKKPKLTKLMIPIHEEELKNWDGQKMYERDMELLEKSKKHLLKPYLLQEIKKDDEKH